MSTPHTPDIDVTVTRGAGLYLRINGHAVDDTYGAIVMAELAQLHDFPAVRVDVALQAAQRPVPAVMARLIATELDRNEIWD